MLSNRDFIEIVSKKEDKEVFKDGKTRFDLKQIEKMERLNKKNKIKSGDDSDEEKLPPGIASKKQKKKLNAGDAEDTADVYRDRAFERRKDLNVNEDAMRMEEVASKLDAEQTKFLGGDEEHTHLVKGLDYLLLQKNRQKTISSSSSIPDNHSDAVLVVAAAAAKTVNNIKTQTLMGNRLKNILLSSHTSKMNLSGSTSTTKSRGNTQLSNALARMAFEYDLDPESLQELPTIISKSKKDQHNEVAKTL